MMHEPFPTIDSSTAGGARRPAFMLFAPGLERLPSPPEGPRLPALERLLARGRRCLLPGPSAAFAELARVVGGDLARWPCGPVSRLGDTGAAPSRPCLRIEPLGLAASARGVARMRAEGLALSGAEAAGLAESLSAWFAADGLEFEATRAFRWYLVGGPGWAGLPGPPGEDGPDAPPESELRRVLSEAEMLLHEHPVNEARLAAGRPAVNGLHAWGGGVPPAPAGRPLPGGWGDEPYLRGLWRLAGHAPRQEPEVRDGGIAWPLPGDAGDPAAALRLEEEWGAPILSALARGRLARVAIVTARTRHDTGNWAVRRPWRRPRPVAELC